MLGVTMKCRKKFKDSNLNENQDITPKSRAIFYGWIVVFCVFAVLFFAFGCAYSFTTFFEALQVEFGATRYSTSLIFSISGFIYFSLGAISGKFADRIGPRLVIIFGIIVIGLALLGASRAATMRQVYLAYGVGIGVGVGFVYVPAVSVVQRWFVRRRGFASGLAVTGIGLGTLCIPLFSALLIDWSNWRIAYLVMGLIVLVCGVSGALFIIESPERLGLQPDGDRAPARCDSSWPDISAEEIPMKIREITVKDALRTRPFWLLYAGCLTISLGLFIPFVHMVPFAKDLGLPKSTGVMLFSLVGASSTGGRFLLGRIADMFGRRSSLAAMYAGMAAMFTWWLVATNVWALAIFAIIFGICYGGYVALVPAVTADYFGGRNMSGIIGALYTSTAIGSLVGPTLAGLAFDLQRSYTIPIIASAIAAVVATASAVLLKDPKRRWG